MALTRRQKEVLDFIAAYQVENGYSPSYEEIARGLDLASIATVHKHISALQTKNYLHRNNNQSWDRSQRVNRSRAIRTRPASASPISSARKTRTPSKCAAIR
jgi:repressor LexA